MGNMLFEMKKIILDMNNILDLVEEMINKLEVGFKEIIQCVVRRNKELENRNIKEKLRDMEGRIVKFRSIIRREQRGWRSGNI